MLRCSGGTHLWKCGPNAAEVAVPPDTELLGLPGTHRRVWSFSLNLIFCFPKASYLELLETLEGHL